MISDNARTLTYLILEDSKSPIFSNLIGASGIQYWVNMMSSFIDNDRVENRRWNGHIFNDGDGLVSFYDGDSAYNMVSEDESEISWNDYFPSDLDSFVITHEEAIQIRAVLSI